MDVIETPNANVPIHTWLPIEEIEPGALEQLANVAAHPDADGFVAVMPDCHQGYGVPIGCVFKTRNAVVPNAVGVDIGCGVTAVQTPLRFEDERATEEFWHAWARTVREEVPMGFAVLAKPVEHELFEEPLRAAELRETVAAKAPVQLGTLGGGNHFLEAQVDENGFVWLMVHSGSRGSGHAIATHYHELAKAETAKRGLAVHRDLASLSFDGDHAMAYLDDMRWAKRYAEVSRAEMLRKALRALGLPGHQFGVIDTPHNYAIELVLDGAALHRKGATPAHLGRRGMVPGSMGASSYIVAGLGVAEAHQSCSHGAGRRMGRKAAERSLTLEEFERAMAGTFTGPRKSMLDESPMVYKPVERVMEQQADLVRIVHTLKPIITLKGDTRAAE